jgi:hypothetical protein
MVTTLGQLPLLTALDGISNLLEVTTTPTCQTVVQQVARHLINTQRSEVVPLVLGAMVGHVGLVGRRAMLQDTLQEISLRPLACLATPTLCHHR